MEYRFHIGQDVVVIKSHSQGKYKEGDVFIVRGLREGCCKVNPLKINIGIPSCAPLSICIYCKEIQQQSEFTYYGSSAFAPLDSLCNIEELTEVLTEPLCEISR